MSTVNDKKRERIRALKFLLISISAGIIQISSTALLEIIPDFPGWISYGIGLVLSVLWNFTINRRYTFRSANNVPIAMLKVAGFYAVFAPLSIWVENIFEQNGWETLIATVVLMVINFILEFLYCTFFVYRGTIDSNDVAKKALEREEKITE